MPDPPPDPPPDPCAALHDTASGDGVPVAFFTDHYCPQCRAVERMLAAREDVAVTHRQFPVLGSASEMAARGAIAARRQGREAAFNRRMQRAAFAPTPAYLADIARSLELDAARFLDDLAAPETAAILDAEVRLGRSLGFYAVPVAVIGGTVVVGNVGEKTLSDVIAAEAAGMSCRAPDQGRAPSSARDVRTATQVRHGQPQVSGFR